MLHPWAKAFFILGILLALQSAWSLLDGYRFLRLVRRSWRRPPGNYQPSAAVIIPCKGLNPGFELNVTRFLAQDYPAYQLIFVVAAEGDPAYRYLAQRLKEPPGRAAKPMLIAAGQSSARGEKVNNLLHGVRAVDPGTEVLVFADADATPGEAWLRSLVAPLEDEGVTVSTGFRWYLPGASFASRLRAAWDTSIATMLGEHDHNFAWGGSMAIRTADFRRLEIANRWWASTVSDDYTLTRAVREAGGRIRFEARCLLKSCEESSLRDFLRWANRQVIITRVYSGRLWWAGLASYSLYCPRHGQGSPPRHRGTRNLSRGTLAARARRVLLLEARPLGSLGDVHELRDLRVCAAHRVARRPLRTVLAGRSSCAERLRAKVRAQQAAPLRAS